MKYLTFPLLLVLMLGNGSVAACSCDPYDTFCAMAGDYLHESWGPSQIVTARPLRTFNFNYPNSGFVQPLFDVIITRSLRGDLAVPGDTITFRLHNGVNCAVGLNQIDTLSEQLFFFRGLGSGGVDYEYDGIIDTFLSTHQITTLQNCGPTFLPLIDGGVYGPIAPGVDSISLEAFTSDEYLCVAAPQEPMEECTRDWASMCDQLTEITSGQNPGNLNLARMEHLGSRFTSSSRGRRALVADFRIMNQEAGNLTQAGDTISVILRGDNRCVSSNGNFRYSPRPGFAYLHYFKSLDRTGGFESEGYESFMSKYPVTEAHRNVRSFVTIREDSITLGFSSNYDRIPYATYTTDLKACAGLVCTRPVGVEDLRVFPNPASERIRVTWEGTVTGLDLMDFTGKIHQRTAVISLQYRHEFDVSHLPPGVYIVRLTTAEGVVARKVMVN
ncbi:MAG: T9SS type A sorting domain-containing protein [Lewinella sp.]